MFSKKDIIAILLIFIIALLLTGDLLFRSGQPATFDGTTHITTMAQFHVGLSQGQFPITWADGFANYGMPIPLIAQQTTNYLGGLITFLTSNVLVSHNIVYLLGAFFSTVFFYSFLRLYFKPEVAIAGAVLFNFSSYRIINIYIRGALPEYFASVFIPVIAIGLYLLSNKRYRSGSALIIAGVAALVATHPFMFIISLFITVPYGIFLLLQTKRKKAFVLLSVISVALGLGLTAIYTVPLFAEVKYFYYSLTKNHLVPNQFLGIQNFFDPNWYYYYHNDVFVRGNFIKAGTGETIILLVGIVISLWLLLKKRIKNNLPLFFTCITALLIIAFMLPQAEVLYNSISLLNGIQHPWRLLGALMFIPPLILCIVLSKLKHQTVVIVVAIILIAGLQFPQLYGKNYTLYPLQTYYFTPENLHGNILNTVWTGKTTEYPIKKTKPEVIDGKGKIGITEVKNGFRKYTVSAETPVRMADYTFYFPGWKAYIDGEETMIQYQDPAYRGVITYNVPQGEHAVLLRFEPTKIRVLGIGISVLSLILSIFFFYGAQKLLKKVGTL